MMTTLASEPCPGCAEGWRLSGDLFCAECYDGKIERLRKALKPFTSDTMPSLKKTKISYNRFGLRCLMSPMEIAMTEAWRVFNDDVGGSGT